MSEKGNLRKKVDYVLEVIKDLVNKNKYVLIPRYKNNLAFIGYTLELVEFTIQELTYKNYVEGPKFNNIHRNNVWIFRYDDIIENIQIYIKFGISRKEDKVCFVSFHKAERELRYFDWR